MNTICIRSEGGGEGEGEREPKPKPGSEIKSFLKDISYNFTLNERGRGRGRCRSAKEIGKKQSRKSTREGKGAAGWVKWKTQAKTPQQPSLYPRVSASCLKKTTARGGSSMRKQGAQQTQPRRSPFPFGCCGEFACAF